MWVRNVHRWIRFVLLGNFYLHNIWNQKQGSRSSVHQLKIVENPVIGKLPAAKVMKDRQALFDNLLCLSLLFDSTVTYLPDPVNARQPDPLPPVDLTDNRV